MRDASDCECVADEECKGFDGVCVYCAGQRVAEECPRGGVAPPPAGHVEVVVDVVPPRCAVHVEAVGPNLAMVCGAEADEDDTVLRTSPVWILAHDGRQLTVRWRDLWLGPR